MRISNTVILFSSELLIGLSILILLVWSFVSERLRRDSALAYRVTVGVLLTAFAFEFGFGRPDGGDVLIAGMLRQDDLAWVFKLILLVSSLLVAGFSVVSKESHPRRDVHVEYVLLLLSTALAMLLLASSVHLLMMYLAFEMLSLPSYLLTALLNRDERAPEAALKFLIYGAVASGVMVYGLSWLYGMTGTLELDGIRAALAQNAHPPGLLLVALLFIFSGMGYKVAAFPFHAWCPDVYEGAPMPFTAFLSVGSKAAGFVLLGRFVYRLFGPAGTGAEPGWFHEAAATQLLAGIAAVSMTLGNFAALRQRNIKRLLAYSGIAHAGYVLMALASRTKPGLHAMVFYLVVYLVMNFGAFLAAILIANEMGTERIEDYEGLAWRGSRGLVLGSAFAIFLFSLCGLPPFAGFIGKVYLLLAVFERGGSLYWLAVVAMINTVVSLAYYARVVGPMFLSWRRPRSAGIALSKTSVLGYSLLTGFAVLTVTLGIYWAPLERFSRVAASWLGAGGG